MRLQAGQNTTLGATDMVVTAARPQAGLPTVDLVALVLGAAGQSRVDADLVFYNQPQHPAGIVVCLPERGPGVSALAVNLARTRPSDERIIIAASTDCGAFTASLPLVVKVVAASGQVLVDAQLPPVGGETALVLLELYRRNRAWKIRAVGQGYPRGLQGLVTTQFASFSETSSW